ncbi:hypothetical protein [Streptomyces sp. NPDC056683]|uniref:hypothetical protein n=1 Tax=Streptomyces sp. NPDC056683 TaxID=3345910 RepID=UPI0036C85229
MSATTVRLDTTTDVVAWIAANAAQVIAAGNHTGHDLDAVMQRMTADSVLETIRAAYTFRCQRGDDRPESVKLIGCRIIAEYCNTFGF